MNLTNPAKLANLVLSGAGRFRRCGSLLVIVAIVAAGPLRADSRGSITEAKLLAERGLHLDAARMFGGLADDPSLPAEERAKALIHEGAALESARKYAEATEAYLGVLEIARTEEIVTLLVQAVTKLVPTAGSLEGSWRRIEIGSVVHAGRLPAAMVIWPDDRVPALALRKDIIHMLAFREDASIGRVAEQFEPQRNWPYANVKPEFVGCEDDARVVHSLPLPVDWEAGLRSLVNLYGLDAALHDGVLTVSCGGGDASTGAGRDLPVVELGLFVGVAARETMLEPCASVRETVELPAIDPIGLATLDEAVRRHVPGPAKLRICGLMAPQMRRVSELIGHFEDDAPRYQDTEYEEWATPEGQRFNMSYTVSGL